MIASARRAGLIVPGVGLIALCALLPFAQSRAGDNGFLLLALGAGAVYLLAATRAHRAGADAIPFVLAVALVLRLALLLPEPLLSQDVYRYMWDGIVQREGFNPYRFVPQAPELAHLRGVPWFALVDKADYAVTIYPPAAQALFRAIAAVSTSTLAFRLTFLVIDAVAVLCLLDLIRRLGRSPGLVLLYAWHPLVPIEVANNGHVDGPMTAFVVVGLWLFQRGHERFAGVAMALAALFKPTALLALPALWRPWHVVLPIVVLATIAAAYLPYLELGGGALGFLPRYLAEERLVDGSAFWLLVVARRALGRPDVGLALYLAFATLVIVGLALRAGFRRDTTFEVRMRDTLALLSAALFFLSPDYPWYFVILLPYLALAGARPLREPVAWPALALSLGGVVLYDVIAGDPQIDFALRDAVFNLTVIAAAAAALIAARRAALTLSREEAG